MSTTDCAGAPGANTSGAPPSGASASGASAYGAIHAADPGRVASAADGWRLAASRLTELRDELAETARRGADAWTSGAGADRFIARCRALADRADRLAAHGTALYERLSDAARALTEAQDSATDPTTAQAAATLLEGVYRDLGERLPTLPATACDTTDPTTPQPPATPPATAVPPPGSAPLPTEPCATGTGAGTATTPGTTDPDPTAPAPPDRTPPAPTTPTIGCGVPTPPPAPPPTPPVPPPTPPPVTTPVATCPAATTPSAPPAPPPPSPPPVGSTTIGGSTPIARAHPPTPPVPAIAAVPLSREPRPVRAAGIGPQPRRAPLPDRAPVPPVTGIRVAPGLRASTDEGPATARDAALASEPPPGVVGGTARDGVAPFHGAPRVSSPTLGGTPVPPSTRPRSGTRYATRRAEEWWEHPT